MLKSRIANFNIGYNYITHGILPKMCLSMIFDQLKRFLFNRLTMDHQNYIYGRSQLIFGTTTIHLLQR